MKIIEDVKRQRLAGLSRRLGLGQEDSEEPVSGSSGLSGSLPSQQRR